MATNTLFAESQQNALFEMESQQGFDYPKPLTEEFKPVRLADFIGLEKQRKVIAGFLARPYPVAMMFSGDAGTGKTSMAYAVARELNATVWHVGSQDCKVDRLKEISHNCNYIPQAGLRGFHVVIVDEADRMSTAAQDYLLSKLDGTEPCPATIWIFTSNDCEKLEKRFLVAQSSSNSTPTGPAKRLQISSRGSGEPRHLARQRLTSKSLPAVTCARLSPASNPNCLRLSGPAIRFGCIASGSRAYFCLTSQRCSLDIISEVI